jgi:hypothetical protein
MKSDKIVATGFNSMLSLTNGEKYYKNIADDGLDIGFTIRNFYFAADSSVYIIYEDGYRSMNNDYFTGSNKNIRLANNSTETKNFLRGDIVVIKANPKGQAEWVRVISKRQVELDLVVYEGVVAAVDNKKNLHLVFNDNRKNTDAEPSKKPATADIEPIPSTNLFQVTINPSGIVDKQVIYENKGRETYLSPDYSIGVGNEIYFITSKTKSLKKGFYTFGSMKF